MLTVSERGEIGLTRGDTAWFDVPINNVLTGEPYEIQEADILTFSIKKTTNDRTHALQKRVTGSNIFHIEPQDTENLMFGKYKYDVELTTANGDVYTVIPPTTFEVLEGVT